MDVWDRKLVIVEVGGLGMEIERQLGRGFTASQTMGQPQPDGAVTGVCPFTGPHIMFKFRI
jgi:hypothetical protein